MIAVPHCRMTPLGRRCQPERPVAAAKLSCGSFQGMVAGVAGAAMLACVTVPCP